MTTANQPDRREPSHHSAPDLVHRMRKAAEMKTTVPVESRTSPSPGIIPEPVLHDEADASTRRGNRRAPGTSTRPAARRGPLARLLAALRGDKYMVDAYPPAESPPNEG